eukprot:TRINITY_DN6367_c0_g1_i3.p1 TRINITY_DN6367_c0_g1~~TRINITY_DN6367_c0_g1_i3.p1  ORF type:complete len:324 (-),score=23.89 TRINITY_DN6367_c0_g1_i3:61-1032(-)
MVFLSLRYLKGNFAENACNGFGIWIPVILSRMYANFDCDFDTKLPIVVFTYTQMIYFLLFLVLTFTKRLPIVTQFIKIKHVLFTCVAGVLAIRALGKRDALCNESNSIYIVVSWAILVYAALRVTLFIANALLMLTKVKIQQNWIIQILRRSELLASIFGFITLLCLLKYANQQTCDPEAIELVGLPFWLFIAIIIVEFFSNLAADLESLRSKTPHKVLDIVLVGLYAVSVIFYGKIVLKYVDPYNDCAINAPFVHFLLRIITYGVVAHAAHYAILHVVYQVMPNIDDPPAFSKRIGVIYRPYPTKRPTDVKKSDQQLSLIHI